MALVLLDRAQETGTANTTVSFTLLGASTGYQSLASVGNGNTTYYGATDGTNWETGIGTYSTTGPTLTRTTILASSNSGSAVTFSGTATVFVDYPASKSVGSQTGYFDSTYQGTFVDGIVLDYDSGSASGRISVGGSDSLKFYNGGVAGSLLGSASASGDWSFTRFVDIGNGTLIGGATNPIFAAAGSANNYVQAYIHNDNSGTSASADFVAYPDNGADTSGWVDMGIASSTYADAVYTVTGPNEGYVFMSNPSAATTATGNLVYATDSTGTTNAHQWYVGGFTQAKSAWKMQLTSSGLSLATALSIGNGGTGQTTKTAAFDALSPITTKGDLIAYNGTDNVRLAVGTDTQVLVADSTTATGLKWAAAGGFSGGTLTSNLTLATGTTSLVPLTMASGTLNTTAVAGAVEFDGFAPYMSIAASTRGALCTEQWVVLTGTNTLTSQTAVQPIFDGGGGPTNGSVTLPVGTYQYECSYAATTLSATSGSFGWALGGTATKTFTYQAQASKAGTALTTPMATVSTFGSAAITTLVANSTGTVANLLVKGIIRVTVAGTVIPQISLTVASAAIIQTGAYFRVSPIGNSTVATVGNWA